MEICCIWAQDKNGAIGKAGGIPWHIPPDFANFKERTAGHAVIMGRKTWESLPKKPLPGRLNIVVSTSANTLEGAKVCKNLADALEIARAAGQEQVFLIGGQAIYEEGLKLATKVYRTIVHVDIENADTFAPPLGDAWKLGMSNAPRQGEAPVFHFEIWSRV